MRNPEQTIYPQYRHLARPRLDRLLIAALLLLTPLRGAGGQQEYHAGEYEIKAAYLLNFPNFVEWPGDSPSDSRVPIHVCLMGQDPLGTTLSRMMADHLSRGRAILLRRVLRTDSVSDCQILYISASEGKFVPQILGSLKSLSILTVGESEQFAEEGGMIQLVLEDKQVRFKINNAAASQAGLRISSKLLALAKIVGPVTRLPVVEVPAGAENAQLLLHGESHGFNQNTIANLN